MQPRRRKRSSLSFTSTERSVHDDSAEELGGRGADCGRVCGALLGRRRQARDGLVHRRQLFPRFPDRAGRLVSGLGAPGPLSGDRDPAERVRPRRRRRQPAGADGRHPGLRAVHHAGLDRRHLDWRAALPLRLGPPAGARLPDCVPAADDSDPVHHLQSDRVSASDLRLARRRKRAGALEHPGASRRQRPDPRQHHARSRRGLQRHPVARLADYPGHRVRLFLRPAAVGAHRSSRCRRFRSRC